MKLQEAKALAYDVLNHLGEEMPRLFGDSSLIADIQEVNQTLSSMSNEEILGMRKTNPSRVIFLLRIYNELLIVLQVS